MQIEQSDSEKKFWGRPELVEKLFLVLDLDSTLNLARVMDREILQQSLASKVWKALLYHSYPSSSFPYWWDGITLTDELTLTDMIVAAQTFAAILKLMTQADDQRANMLDLLDTICKRNPPDVGSESPFRKVTISCLNHPDSHQVFLEDFFLLEAIEGALGTSEQKAISSTGCFLDGSSLSALSSRLARQQEKLTLLGFGFLDVRSLESAQAFKTLMQASSEVVSGRPYSTQ